MIWIKINFVLSESCGLLCALRTEHVQRLQHERIQTQALNTKGKIWTVLFVVATFVLPNLGDHFLSFQLVFNILEFLVQPSGLFFYLVDDLKGDIFLRFQRNVVFIGL